MEFLPGALCRSYRQSRRSDLHSAAARALIPRIGTVLKLAMHASCNEATLIELTGMCCTNKSKLERQVGSRDCQGGFLY